MRHTGNLSSKTLKSALLASAMVLVPSSVYAQDADSDQEAVEEVVVVGSHIKGAKVTDMLPVAVLDAGDIEGTGTISGNELFRSIPQMGFQAINNEDTAGGINAARGDVASINLRALGTGNTLMLLNGRRMVLHPGYQTENLVPVTTVNTNTVPVMGVERLEILLGGASAIYGTDAVGGVINTVLQKDIEGITGQIRFGSEEGTSLEELSATVKAGMSFNGGQTHLSLFGNYMDREGVWAADRPRFADRDLRPFVEDNPDWAGDSNFRNTSSHTAWGRFDSGARVRDLDGNSLTSSGGTFHIQPQSQSGCRIDLVADPNLCIDDGSITSAQYYNLNGPTKMSGDVERLNTYAYLTHEFENGTEFYAEAGYYEAETLRPIYQASVLSSHRFWVPASSYWNPFGATTLENGDPNPNRLPNLDIDEEGRDIFIDRYRPTDAGTRNINVNLESYRFVAGLRGTSGDWDWDTGIVQSESKSNDTTVRISNSLFAAAIARNDPSAYNIWSGGNRADMTGEDGTPAAQATIDSFMVPVTRIGKTSLSMWDFKASHANVFSLPAGDVGFAVGGEVRRESYLDDRDDRLDGTIQFTDLVTGETLQSDVLGSSPTNDSSGDRKVISIFGEFAVPLVLDAPMMKSLDMQVAARYENFSDVGSTFKPKVAMSWFVNDDFQIRGSWAKGFRAPNLPQINETVLSRVNTRTDYIRCEADFLNGTNAEWDDCSGHSGGVESRRTGSKELKNEQIDNKSFGATYSPSFAPGLTFTFDWWRIHQSDLVSIFTDRNHIIYDYLLRVRGQSNPNVVRAAADEDDLELFAGTGITPVGEVLYVNDPYLNLESRLVKGMDMAAYYDWSDDQLGDFKFKINVAHLTEFYQTPGAIAQEILDAQAAGEISDTIDVSGAGSLMKLNSRPEWRWSASVRWRKDNWGASLHSRYVGDIWDTGATQNDTGDYWVVEGTTTFNGSIDYYFGDQNDYRVRLGVNNIAGKLPPLSDNSFGYESDLYSARGRYFYMSLRGSF